MRFFIGGISALQYLLSSGTPDRRRYGAGKTPSPTRAMPQPGERPDYRLLREYGKPEEIVTKKLHINVASKGDVSKSDLLVCHVWPAPEKGSYLQISPAYYVLTPEACFAQMAAELPLSQLTELAMMMCGTFAPRPYGRSTLYDVSPLSNPKKLQDYVARLDNRKGLKNARIAAGLAASGAGSPMEAKLAAYLALPTKHGGMGLPAQLNPTIKLTDGARGSSATQDRRPDFLWPQLNTALDYDGAEFHDPTPLAQRDTTRRNQLSSMGIKCVTARNRPQREPARRTSPTATNGPAARGHGQPTRPKSPRAAGKACPAI